MTQMMCYVASRQARPVSTLRSSTNAPLIPGLEVGNPSDKSACSSYREKVFAVQTKTPRRCAGVSVRIPVRFFCAGVSRVLHGCRQPA